MCEEKDWKQPEWGCCCLCKKSLCLTYGQVRRRESYTNSFKSSRRKDDLWRHSGRSLMRDWQSCFKFCAIFAGHLQSLLISTAKRPKHCVFMPIMFYTLCLEIQEENVQSRFLACVIHLPHATSQWINAVSFFKDSRNRWLIAVFAEA